MALRALLVAGVDEAGRGPLAGPVVAAAVILDPARPIEGLADSKALSARRRGVLAAAIRERAKAHAVAHADVEEIDAIDILRATMLAMRRAVEALAVVPQEVLVDGNRCPELGCAVRAIVKGDRDVPAISAASILAKTVRDDALRQLHELWPMYRFDLHKGYPTAEHLRRLREFGPSPAHRRSFGPVRLLLAGTQGRR